MTGTQRCRSCDARNPHGAAWCTQCYESLAPPAPPAPSSVGAPPVAPGVPGAPGRTGGDASVPPPPPSSPPPSPPPASPPPRRLAGLDDVDGLLPLPPGRGEPPPPAAPRAVVAGDGRFRDAADGLEWRCDTCETWNPIELVTCRVCGAAFMRAGGEDSGPVREVAPALLLATTVALPGAGHGLLGSWGQAFFRAVLAIVWGLGGFALLRNALATGQPVLPAVPLLAGWLALVVASVNDVLVAGDVLDGRVLLEGRPLLWLVMGVIAATIGAAFVGALGAVAA